MNQHRSAVRTAQYRVELHARINSSVWIADIIGYAESWIKADVEKCVSNPIVSLVGMSERAVLLIGNTR
jgi:hypothetical protein